MRAIVQGIRGNRGCGVKRNITGAMLLFLATVSLSNAADKPVWIDNAANISIPSIPAEGIAHGKKFKVEKATIQNGILELRQGQGFFPDYSFMIFTLPLIAVVCNFIPLDLFQIFRATLRYCI